MKQRHFYFLFLTLLFSATSFGQTQNIIERVINKDPTLSIYKAKDGGNYVVAAAIDKQTHISYLLSCFGQIVDSTHIADGDYEFILNKKSTPFKHYNAICDKILELANTAKGQLRKNGKINTKWQYASLISEYLPALKTSPSSLQKIIFFDDLCQSYLVSKWLVNNPNPKYFTEDTATLYTKFDKVKAGTMLLKTDTTIYYNQNNIARAYKAILLNKNAKLFYYDRDNILIDSLPLNPKKVSVVIKQKTDVFLLYRGWLEMQKQSIEEGIRILDSTNRKYPNTLVQFADNKTSNIDEIIFEAKQSLARTIYNISVASIPDPKAIATFLHEEYKNVEVNKSLLTALDIGYISTFTRGNKIYELTDHRGNVLATVSDKKIQVDANNDGIVDYYVADVVSATDYSTFGAQLPGRTYQSEKYRYSINGQEKSDELNPNLTTAMYWEYDSRIGRRWNTDPKPVVGVSDYAVFDNNPILRTDPDGDCPICGLIGAGIGALVGGGIEIATQLYKNRGTNNSLNWKAVAGSTLQGAITGGVAGLTGGASLIVTVTASGTANAVGGAVNNAIQGKKITVRSVATDFAIGAVTGGITHNLAKTNIVAQSLTQQEGRIINYTLNNGKILFNNSMKNSGSFDFVVKGGKVLIGEGHYFMSANSKIVAGAGTISIENGVIKTITNWSGHYKPSASQMSAAVKMLTKAGFKFAKGFDKVITK